MSAPQPVNVSGRAQYVARLRSLATVMNLHLAGAAVLAIITLYALGHLAVTWQQLRANNQEALDQQRMQMMSAEIAARPLSGLDEKLTKSHEDADKFYAGRLPNGYAEVAAEVGKLTKAKNVRLSRVQYAETEELSGQGALHEVRMDASVSGDYRPVVELINGLERDRMFIIVNSLTLSGQQNGQVNLRIRMTTFLRTALPAELNAHSLDDDEQGGAR